MAEPTLARKSKNEVVMKFNLRDDTPVMAGTPATIELSFFGKATLAIATLDSQYQYFGLSLCHPNHRYDPYIGMRVAAKIAFFDKCFPHVRIGKELSKSIYSDFRKAMHQLEQRRVEKYND